MHIDYTAEKSAANQNKFPERESPALTGNHVTRGSGHTAFLPLTPLFLFSWERTIKGIKQ